MTIDTALAEARIQGFGAVSDTRSHTLILGSMPGVESLRLGHYYANPRNAFWSIMGDLFDIDPRSAIDDRTSALRAHGIAIWDVLCACVRRGSLDSAIAPDSIQVNDFAAFYQRHPNINRVLFNGAFAEATYRRHVLPTLSSPQAGILYRRLPSSSPANASTRYAAKRDAWRVALEVV